MSTNPFNDDYNVAPSTSTSFLPSSIPSHQQQQHQQPHHSQVNSNNNLPPPSQPPQPSHPPPSSLSLLPSPSFSNQHQEQSSLPPIWIARNVEWPLVSTLPSSIFTKLYRTSRNAGTSLGIATVTTNSVTVGNTTSSLLSIPSSKSMVAGTTVSSNYTDMESMNHNTSNHNRFGNNNNNWSPNSMNDHNNNGNLDNGSGYDNNDEFNNNSNADAKFSGSSSIVSGGGFGSNNTARGGANGMIVLAWSEQEAARYLETFKVFEGKDASSIQKRGEQNFTDQMANLLSSVRSVNKTDSAHLLSQFGSLKALVSAPMKMLPNVAMKPNLS